MKTKVSVIFLVLAIIINSVNCNQGVYKHCDGASKHCLECLQMEMYWLQKYEMVPNQNLFQDSLLYAVNEYRSKYAERFSIGNMRYAAWNKLFQKICSDLIVDAGDTKFYCVTSSKLLRDPTRFDHDLIDFESNVDIKVYKNSTIMFQEQFKILLNKVFAVQHVTEYNMDEFACGYAVQTQNDSMAFLLRCIFYTNPEYETEK